MKTKSLKPLKCSYHSCNNVEMVDQAVTTVICHMCVQGMVGTSFNKVPKKSNDEWIQRKLIIAEEKKKKAEYREKYKGFPRCWWLKTLYIHKDGRKFSKGKEIA